MAEERHQFAGLRRDARAQEQTRLSTGAPPPHGDWTADVAEAYAQRVLTRLGRRVVNLDRVTIKSAVLSPADLERYNINLVGGDPYSGACTLGQFHLRRPFPGSRNHHTVVNGFATFSELFIIGQRIDIWLWLYIYS